MGVMHLLPEDALLLLKNLLKKRIED